MRKRYRILIALLVVAIAGVIAREVLRERQPVYQGKKLFYWLMQHAKTSEPPNQNSVAHEAAEIAILHIGTNGLPALLAWASTRDSPLKKKMRTLMSNVVRGEYGFKANDYHAAASYGFGVLKSVAEPAVPGLIKRSLKRRNQPRNTAEFRTCVAAFPRSEAMGSGSIKGNVGIAFHQ